MMDRVERLHAEKHKLEDRLAQAEQQALVGEEEGRGGKERARRGGRGGRGGEGGEGREGRHSRRGKKYNE